MRRSNHSGDLDQMWDVGRYAIVYVITYAIFFDCRLRSMGAVRGVSLRSPIDLSYRPYNTGQCDRVINCSVIGDALGGI